MKKWLKEWAKNHFALFELEELQTGGWCGCCGAWLPDIIVPKWWPYSICTNGCPDDKIQNANAT
jgi:hypothetical protein